MTDKCIFCDIAKGALPSKRVYEDPLAVAFHDINPVAPTHILVIPRQHIGELTAAAPSDEAVLGHMLAVAPKIAAKQGVAADGYRLVINQGDNAGQIVAHLHLHIIGGKRLSKMG